MERNKDFELKVMDVKRLVPFELRGIRQSVIDKLKERINSASYNPAHPLTVVFQNGEYIVVDGNHRLKVLNELGIENVNCIVYDGVSPYRLAVEGNNDEDTYAPMDLFDWLELIQHMKSEGMTQKEIGEEIGWSKQMVSYYSNVTEKLSTNFLSQAKKHQTARVYEKSTMVDFCFTERWFRDSGLYDLNEEYQMEFFSYFKADDFKWKKNKVQSETKKYKQYMEFEIITEEKMMNGSEIPKLKEMIKNGNFRSLEQLVSKIEVFNKKAKNKLINDDCLKALKDIEDGTIDVVITDPPYGIDYKSNRSQYTEHVTKNKIINDKNEAFGLLNDVCKLLKEKTKANSHLYFFTSWKVYSEFEKIISEYFIIKNMIVWDKGNHGAGDLEGSWGNRHELIIFAIKGNKGFNRRKADILNVNKLNSSNMIHPTQKPTGIIKELLEASAVNADVICDPFMGSGSTIKAVKEYGDLNYIGIELDRNFFDKAKAFIGGV